MVEYDLPKVGVEGSNPFSRSKAYPKGIRRERSQVLRPIREQDQRMADPRRSESRAAPISLFPLRLRFTVVVGLHQAGPEGCEEVICGRSSNKSRGAVQYFAERAFSNPGALRKTGRRPCRRLFPAHQHSTPPGVSGFR